MKRRAFLGFLGGAAAAGPSVAKQAASNLSLADLAVPYMGVEGNSLVGEATKMGGGPKEWAKQSLAQLVGKSAERIAIERRRHGIGGLDPEIASLRSVALHHKIEMSRSIAYERNQRNEKSWLQAQIDGLFGEEW